MQEDGESMESHFLVGLHLPLAMLDLQLLVHPALWRYLRNYDTAWFFMLLYFVNLSV